MKFKAALSPLVFIHVKVLWSPAPPDFRELSSLKEPLLTTLLMDIYICIEYKSGNGPQDRKERGRGSEIKWKSKENFQIKSSK